LVACTAAAAIGARWYGSDDLHKRNARLADHASSALRSALAHKTYYLQDVADMVGVHDDADAEEFSRYSRVRDGADRTVLLVQWLRRSPSGRLLPPRETGPRPILLRSPSLALSSLRTAKLVQAEAKMVAQATLERRPAASSPLGLDGRTSVLVAVPVRPHHNSGQLSKFESRSVILGIVNSDRLTTTSLSRAGINARVILSDGGLPRSANSRDWTQREFTFGQRDWRVLVEPVRRSTQATWLPLLILSAGLLLALALAVVLRSIQTRGARAMELAGERGSQLAESLEMTKRIADAIEERFYTYELLPDGGRRTLLMTGGWAFGEAADVVEDWERHVHPDDQAVWREAADAIRDGRPVDVEFRLSTDADERWIWTRERPLGIVDGRRLVDGVASDVTKRKRAEVALAQAVGDMRDANRELADAHAEADRRSRTDALTGAFNRRHFTDLLEGELNRARPDGKVAVMLVDIDHFKSVNDFHGHLAGDEILCEITRRISTALGPTDRLARWGGDEFAIVAGDVADVATLAAKAQAVLAAVGGEPITRERDRLPVTVSVGVAHVVAGDRTPEEVVEIVDQALYEAKRAGRNRIAAAPPYSRLRAVA
jgi:diguanylate cyclase (GGDEF)-like protein